MGDHKGFLFMFSMRNHTRSCTYVAFFSNLLRAMFILQRTNFVSTKNIDNCVLLFLYVLPIDDQAEVRRNADIQVPEGCHWPSHYIECMMEEKKKDHLIIMILKASVTNLPVHRDGCLRYEFQFTMYPLNTFRPLFMDGELSFKGNCEIHVSTFNKRVNFVKLQP